MLLATNSDVFPLLLTEFSFVKSVALLSCPMPFRYGCAFFEVLVADVCGLDFLNGYHVFFPLYELHKLVVVLFRAVFVLLS